MHLVNKYMDMYHAEHILAYRAKAERYAKVLSKTIISPTKTTDYIRVYACLPQMVQISRFQTIRDI